MTNNIRILKNSASTITCTLPSGFTGTTLLTVSALEFENSVLFQVTGNTVNSNAIFVVSADHNNLDERVYFYQVTSGIITLATGSYSIETSPDIAPMPIISGQVNVNIATDFYDKEDINSYSANTLIKINSKLPIVTFAAYTGSSLNNYYTKSQDDILFVKYSGLTWSNLLSKPTLFDGAYNSLSGKPTLFSGAYSGLTGKPTLFSGSYNDLTSKPNLGVYLTGVTWSQVSSKPTLFSGAYSGLTGKPNLAIYLTGVTWSQVSSKPTLFDGAYASLSGKPTLFSGVYADLTSKPVLFTGNTFTASGGTRLRLIGNNLTIYSITGGTGGGGTWGSITGTLSSQTDLNTALGLKLNSSDVSAWAKAGTKPSYTYSEVSALSATGCAVDSAKLNNKLPAYYLNTGSTALCSTSSIDSKALCGCSPSCFLGASSTAVCATCAISAKALCGCVPASFLLSGGTAVCATNAINSACLGSVAAAGYLTTNGSINTLSCTSYGLVAADCGKTVEFTTTASTSIYLPTGLTVGFQANIVNVGGGNKTFCACTGSVLHSLSSKVILAGAYNAASVYYRCTNNWVILGNLY